MGAGMSLSSSDEAKTEKMESGASRELAAANPDEAKMPVSSSDEAKAGKIESESSRELASEKSEEAKTENGSPGGEKEGECPLCLFMKAGGCKESFIAWEKCIEDSENGKDDREKKCLKVTAALIECMQAHFDHYEPILKLHEVMDAELVAARDSEQTKADDHPEEAVSKKNKKHD